MLRSPFNCHLLMLLWLLLARFPEYPIEVRIALRGDEKKGRSLPPRVQTPEQQSLVDAVRQHLHGSAEATKQMPCFSKCCTWRWRGSIQRHPGRHG